MEVIPVVRRCGRRLGLFEVIASWEEENDEPVKNRAAGGNAAVKQVKQCTGSKAVVNG